MVVLARGEQLLGFRCSAHVSRCSTRGALDASQSSWSYWCDSTSSPRQLALLSKLVRRGTEGPRGGARTHWADALCGGLMAAESSDQSFPLALSSLALFLSLLSPIWQSGHRVAKWPPMESPQRARCRRSTKRRDCGVTWGASALCSSWPLSSIQHQGTTACWYLRLLLVLFYYTNEYLENYSIKMHLNKCKWYNINRCLLNSRVTVYALYLVMNKSKMSIQ